MCVRVCLVCVRARGAPIELPCEGPPKGPGSAKNIDREALNQYKNIDREALKYKQYKNIDREAQ